MQLPQILLIPATYVLRKWVEIEVFSLEYRYHFAFKILFKIIMTHKIETWDQNNN